MREDWTFCPSMHESGWKMSFYYEARLVALSVVTQDEQGGSILQSN